MAKQVILYRVDEPFTKTAPFDKLLGGDEGVAPQSRSAPGGDNVDMSEIRTKLRLAYADMQRRYPNLNDNTHLGWAWQRLTDEERQALLEDEDDGVDPSFEESTIVNPEIAVGKLADFMLEVRAEQIGKARRLSKEKATTAAIDERPDFFKLSRGAKRAGLARGDDDAVLAKRNEAYFEIHKRAMELRKSDPSLTIERARTAARARWPELARLERN
jgi:hypothetical protein